MTVHLVDQQQVAAADVDEFLALVHERGVPLMEAAGASFVRCEAAPDLGDDVDVLTVWSFPDFVEWNRIRRNLMFDPRYFPYAAELARRRHGGTRRFYAGDDVLGPGPDDHGPALRRWEMFSLAPDAPVAAASGCGGRCATAPGSSPASRGARSVPTPRAARSSWSGRPPTSRSGRTAAPT